MRLKPCPCCKSRAYYADIQLKGSKMWQVTCEACGLSTEYDDDRAFCRDRWNLREEYRHVKMWTTLLSALLPVVAVTAFFVGYLLNSKLYLSG